MPVDDNLFAAADPPGANEMIEPLKSDDIVNKVGGKFKLVALVQRRLKELVDGSRPLVETQGRNLVEIAIHEVMEDKIDIDWERSEGLYRPDDMDELLEKAAKVDAAHK